MKERHRKLAHMGGIGWRAFIVLAMVAVLTWPVGCGQTNAESNKVRLSGAWDLYPLYLAINGASAKNSDVPPVTMTPTNDAIAELKAGKFDAVLLGREPTSDELSGLSKFPIALDAVCIIIDTNSYEGGQRTMSGLMHQEPGLTNLTTGNLNHIVSETGVAPMLTGTMHGVDYEITSFDGLLV